MENINLNDQIGVRLTELGIAEFIVYYKDDDKRLFKSRTNSDGLTSMQLHEFIDIYKDYFPYAVHTVLSSTNLVILK